LVCGSTTRACVLYKRVCTCMSDYSCTESTMLLHHISPVVGCVGVLGAHTAASVPHKPNNRLIAGSDCCSRWPN
jgi:hypothetical protein